MGGEQAANVLATVARDQRAREGKQVNAVSSPPPGVAVIPPRFRASQWTPRSPGAVHPESLHAHGPGAQCVGPGFLEDTELKGVASGINIYMFSVSLFSTISFEVPSCANTQTFSKHFKKLPVSAWGIKMFDS